MLIAEVRLAHTFSEIKIQKIYLDNANPRHELIDNEAALIAELVLSEQVLALAEDIAEQGMLSPLDRLAVVEHPTARGYYVVAEGNRRLCALKLLQDPDKAPSEQKKKQFAALAKKIASPITNVDAAVFPSMQSAAHWLSLRHEGEQGGVGVKQWGTAAKARFSSTSGTAKNPNIQADLVIQYAVSNGIVSKADAEKLSVTTITRYLSNPVFRSTLGLVNNRDLSVKVPQAEFNKVLQVFLVDALKGTNVSSRTDKIARETYADSLRQRKVAPTNVLTQPVQLSARTGAPLANQPGVRNATRNNSSPDKRPTVVPSDFKAVIKDNVLKRVFDELRTVDSESHTFAAAYLARAFSEHLAKLYAAKHGLPNKKLLHEIIEQCLVHVDPTSADRNLKPFRKMATEKDSRWSPDSLGSWVHGGTIPTRSELNRFWDTHQYGFRKLLNGLL